MLKKSTFVGSSSHYAQCPQDQHPEVAFIGRSNVGKSSLINALLGRKQLAKTSKKPGKTQLINHFLVNDSYYLVDLPGYGWAKVSKGKKMQWEKMVQDYLRYRSNLITLLVLVDGRLSPQPIDLALITWLGKNKIPFTIVLTKVDKKTKITFTKCLHPLAEILKKEWETLPTIFISSSRNKVGMLDLRDYLEKIAAKKDLTSQ